MKFLALPRRVGLVLAVTASLGFACDPPAEPPDGMITLRNDSSEPLVAVFGSGEPGHEPVLEELWEVQRRIRSAAPGETSFLQIPTDLGSEPNTWCLPGKTIVVLLRPLDGQPVDGVVGSDRYDDDYAWSEFEIVEWYGPNFCVGSEDYELAYRG